MAATPPSSRRWPLLIAAAVLAFVAALAGSLYWGVTRASRVSDPSYYTRGLGYGARLRAEQATRGWGMAVARRDGVLELTVTDAAGQPVPGLTGELALLGADGVEDTAVALTPGPAPGEYRASLPSLPPGGARAVATLSRAGGPHAATLRRPLLLAP